MAIAQPVRPGKNAIDIYDKDFDDSIQYGIKLTDKNFCSVAVVVDVDSVSFCDDTAQMNFTLECLPHGEYKLEVFDKTNENVIYTLNSKFYK